LDRFKQLVTSKTGLAVNDIPKEVLQYLKKVVQTKTARSIAGEGEICDMSLIPTQLLYTLLPFQIRGVEFALRNEGRVIICDEMGLGKTIQSIAIACCYRNEWPLLVIVPASLKDQWAAEFERWLPELLFDIRVVTTGSEGII
jgi:SNF2 family DNA or RNA helicase